MFEFIIKHDAPKSSIKPDISQFMNILLVTKNYPPNICGVGDHSFQLKQEWEKMGHEVWIFTTGKKTYEAAVISFDENEFSAAITSQLVAIITRHQIDCLFWQYVPYSYQQKGLPAWLPKTMQQLGKTGVQQSVFFHEISLRLWGDGPRQSVLAFIQRRIANKIASLVEYAFTSIPLYQSYFKHKMPELVPVGTNLPLPNENIVVDPFLIVCFANRADEALLEAVLCLRQSNPVRLTLCGSLDTDRRHQIEAWTRQHHANDWLAITGALPATELSECIAKAAVFIQPQVTDQKGRGGISAKNGTIMAAMSMGKAIISCKGDMTDPSIFQENENMLFVPYRDAAAYEAALRKLLGDPEEAERLGRNAVKTYQEHAAWPKIAAELIAGMVN